MPDKKDVEKVIKQWRKKADHDLKVAEHKIAAPFLFPYLDGRG